MGISIDIDNQDALIRVFRRIRMIDLLHASARFYHLNDLLKGDPSFLFEDRILLCIPLKRSHVRIIETISIHCQPDFQTTDPTKDGEKTDRRQKTTWFNQDMGSLATQGGNSGGTPSSASAAHEKVHGEAILEKAWLDGREDSETLSLPLCIQICG